MSACSGAQQVLSQTFVLRHVWSHKKEGYRANTHTLMCSVAQQVLRQPLVLRHPRNCRQKGTEQSHVRARESWRACENPQHVKNPPSIVDSALGFTLVMVSHLACLKRLMWLACLYWLIWVAPEDLSDGLRGWLGFDFSIPVLFVLQGVLGDWLRAAAVHFGGQRLIVLERCRWYVDACALYKHDNQDGGIIGVSCIERPHAMAISFPTSYMN
eukprot:1161599-Pelagomonas_calceolata.AAC.10